MIRWAAAVLLAGSAGTALSQDSPPPNGTHRVPTPCEVGPGEALGYCARCDAFDAAFDCGLTCGSCGENLVLRTACIRTAYSCAGCGKELAEPAGCCPGNSVIADPEPALLLYRCEGCDASGTREAPCGDASCRANGYWIRKSCSASGVWPHGGIEPDE